MGKITNLFLLITLFYAGQASAQQDTITSYMRNMYAGYDMIRGTPIENKDSADFIRRITKPDTSAGSDLFPVTDYYLNGKPKLIGTLVIGNFTADLEGSCIEFYPNGQKKIICSYKNGRREGDAIAYYANGKIYETGKYYQGKLVLVSCNDSTGKVLAENGNGRWIQLKSDYKTLLQEGEVVDGLEDGEWKYYPSDDVYCICQYRRGELISGISYDKQGNKYPFTSFEMLPEFDGGVQGFTKFLQKNSHYPTDAKARKIQGRVILTFVIEKDGSLTGIRVARSIDPLLNEEAIRILKLSPPWKPGLQNGRPVRVQYTVPINFSLAGR